MLNFCSNCNNKVEDYDLQKLSSGNLICITCFRSLQKLPKRNDFDSKNKFEHIFRNTFKISIFLHPSTERDLLNLIEKGSKELPITALLGKTIDYLTDLGYKEITLLSVEELPSKHETKSFIFKFKNEANESLKETFFVKSLDQVTAEVEELSGRFLHELDITKIKTKLLPGNKEFQIYISPKFPNSISTIGASIGIVDLNSNVLIKEEIQKQFILIMAVWFFWGKGDFLHNQLLSSDYQGNPIFIQLDHENKEPPLSKFCHPSGMDLNWQKNKKIIRKKEHLDEYKVVMNYLGIGFDSALNESVNPDFIKKFNKRIMNISEFVRKNSELKSLIHKKIGLGNVIQWHDSLVQLYDQNKLLFEKLFPELTNVSLDSIQKDIKQLRGIWKQFVKTSVIDSYKLEDFPHQFLYREDRIQLQKIENFLEICKAPKPMITKFQNFKEQLSKSKKIWIEILIQGKIKDIIQAGLVHTNGRIFR